MSLTADIEKILSASVLRVRMRCPFFATLALFTHFHTTHTHPTAATDGKNIYFNPEFVRSLSSPQVDGVLLHEVLHAALLHGVRRGTREPLLWNIAADIVVNGAIAEQQCFELPEGTIRDPELEHLSVEEVYEILLPHAERYVLDEGACDLLDMPPGDSLSESSRQVLETYWRNAVQRAIAIARASQQQGNIPAGLWRELGSLTQAQLDWRSYLWRYLVKTPNDFTGFDRRFIGRGLYLEALEGETVQVFVAVDTSGSICDAQMQLFLSEVRGILQSYPHLKCELYYADAEAYGPYSLEGETTIPQPVGGGGTSFIPFFEKVNAQLDWHSTQICVYLTDGYGDFPLTPPEIPVLWVVTPGGLALEAFPFGETVRLLSEDGFS